MKYVYLALALCTLSTFYAQKQYSCYRIQEFHPKSAAQQDKPVEHADFSTFIFDEQRKSLTQQFEDGTSSVLAIKSVNSEAKAEQTNYQVVSPANGYTYIYRVIPSSKVIEVALIQNGDELLLKKYLYKL